MNKKGRTGLIVVLTAILWVTLVIPGMAKEDNVPLCFPDALTVDASGKFNLNRAVDVLNAESYWEDDLLINICEGEIPLGDPISSGVRYATFDENVEYFCDIDPDCSVTKGGVTVTTTDFVYDFLRDLDTMDWYTATFGQYTLCRSGDFVIYKDNR